MLCPKCNLRETTSSSTCSVCRLKLLTPNPSEPNVTDDDIITHHTLKRVAEGCRECGSKSFAYEAGVKEENEILRKTMDFLLDYIQIISIIQHNIFTYVNIVI